MKDIRTQTHNAKVTWRCEHCESGFATYEDLDRHWKRNDICCEEHKMCFPKSEEQNHANTYQHTSCSLKFCAAGDCDVRGRRNVEPLKVWEHMRKVKEERIADRPMIGKSNGVVAFRGEAMPHEAGPRTEGERCSQHKRLPTPRQYRLDWANLVRKRSSMYQQILVSGARGEMLGIKPDSLPGPTRSVLRPARSYTADEGRSRLEATSMQT